MRKATIIYTTDGKLDARIQAYCFERLKLAAGKHGIIKVENPEGAESGHRAMYENILAGIAAARTKLVFLAEHDVLYPDGYFDLDECPPLSYSKNVLYLTEKGFAKRTIANAPLSTFAGDKAVLKKGIEAKLSAAKIKSAEIGFDDDLAGLTTFRENREPVVDIRHGGNLTGGRKKLRYFAKHPYWGVASEIWAVLAGGGENGKTVSVPTGESNAVDDVAAKTSVVITSRCEPLLAWTIANLNRTAPGCEIIVVLDGWQSPPLDIPSDVRILTPWPVPQGVGPCRDHGIAAATREFVVVLDAHMDFVDGWLDRLVISGGELSAKTISCSQSLVLRTNQLDMDRAEKLNTGAVMQWINEKDMPFEPKWVKAVPGEVQIVLGACYCMRRTHYMETLHRPWRNAFGWGTSEQLISTVNWLLGGTNILTAAITGHVYRERFEQTPYGGEAGMLTGLFYNRCRLIDLLPLDFERKKLLIDLVLDRKDARRYQNNVKNLFETRPDDELKRDLRENGRSWEEFVARWYPKGVRWPKPTEKRRRIKRPGIARRRIIDPGRRMINMENADGRFV